MTVETLRTPKVVVSVYGAAMPTTLTIHLRVDDSYVLHAEA